MQKNKNLKWILSILALLGVVMAWLAGQSRYEKENINRLSGIYSSTVQLEKLSNNIFLTLDSNRHSNYLSIGMARGYEGPVKCAVMIDSAGLIIGINIIEHSETPSYFKKINRSKYLQYFLDQPIQHVFENENGPDAVSGATYTSLAINKAIYDASKRLAEETLNIKVPERKQEIFYFRFLDILLVVFFIAVVLIRKLKPVPKRWARTILLLTSVITLGFTYNFHLTVSRFNTLLLGYWPDIYHSLSWYILIFGTIILTFVSGKNPYCHWFCPFGAVQEGIGAILKYKIHIPQKVMRSLLWLPRLLAWMAIVIALYLRNPGYTSYEVFGMFFTLTGSGLLFALTVATLIFSLFINRPWCNFLCPVPPVIDFIIYLRKRVSGLWAGKKSIKRSRSI